jgi:hypothetical protein
MVLKANNQRESIVVDKFLENNWKTVVVLVIVGFLVFNAYEMYQEKKVTWATQREDAERTAKKASEAKSLADELKDALSRYDSETDKGAPGSERDLVRSMIYKVESVVPERGGYLTIIRLQNGDVRLLLLPDEVKAGEWYQADSQRKLRSFDQR